MEVGEGRFVWYALRAGVLEDVVEAGVPGDVLNLGCCRLELPLGPDDRPAAGTC